jgi:hypothetical protein
MFSEMNERLSPGAALDLIVVLVFGGFVLLLATQRSDVTLAVALGLIGCGGLFLLQFAIGINNGEPTLSEAGDTRAIFLFALSLASVSWALLFT